MLKFILLSLICLTSFSSNATIYIVAYDQATGAMGSAVSSSGRATYENEKFHIYRHGVGLVSAGGMGMCSKATPERFLEMGMTAKEIGLAIARQCDPIEPYYRLGVVTANGDVYVHSGADGCNPDNIECANIQGDGFAVTGGGLHEGVAEAAFEFFGNLPKFIPLECRLYSTLEKVYADGGEYLNFNKAGIVVSYPNHPGLDAWHTLSREWKLLAKIKSKMQKDNFHCEGW